MRSGRDRDLRQRNEPRHRRQRDRRPRQRRRSRRQRPHDPRELHRHRRLRHAELGIEDEGIPAIATDHTIGGTAADQGNVIGGAAPGISLGGSNNTVYGNFLGTDTTGTIDLGNDTTGITVTGSDNIVGGPAAGEANIIAFNGAISGAGVSVSGQRVRIRGNRIYENRSASGPGLGIELGSFGIQVNDPGDGDSGANGFQNYPILLSAGPAFAEGGSNHIVGVLNSTPSTQFTIDFYANPPCAAQPQEFLEGEIPLGSTFVTTDGSGNATIDISIGPPQPPGSRYHRDGDRSGREHLGVLPAHRLLAQQPDVGTAARAARPSRSRACCSRTGRP